MAKVWEFYENMDEIIYVSDVETYEMVYANPKACEVCGYHSLSEIKGKKCYEVLQNQSSPCEFCTNRYLKVGEFYEWQHFNPAAGKNFSLKDTLIKEDGKNYRMELAFDLTLQEEQRKTIQTFASNEKMINEGLRIALAEDTPDKSLQVLLDYLGQNLKSERAYIFEENSEGTLDNTYEWCSEGVIAQKESLQKVPFEVVALWYDAFNKNENVVIQDVEGIKESDPLAYEYLKPQDIQTLVVSPIVDNNKIIGFYGVDNPPGEQLNHISTLFWIVGHFISSILKRRDLVKRLEKLSLFDQLTQVRNRHAMREYVATLSKEESIGILYCDVLGLKRINDTEGHHEGDNLLVRACECLKKYFEEYMLFRIGGDEFLVICNSISKEEMTKRVEKLVKDMEKENAIMSMGVIWEANGKKDFEQLLIEADIKMYEDKQKHYAKSGKSRENKD